MSSPPTAAGASLARGALAAPGCESGLAPSPEHVAGVLDRADDRADLLDHALHEEVQSDTEKKGIVGLLTDIRGRRGDSTGVNPRRRA